MGRVARDPDLLLGVGMPGGVLLAQLEARGPARELDDVSLQRLQRLSEFSVRGNRTGREEGRVHSGGRVVGRVARCPLSRGSFA